MSEDTEPVVRIATDNGVGVIELNRPDKFNCLSAAVIDGIGEGLSRFESNDGVRAVLVRAAGKHFCTGADLDEITGLRQSSEARAGIERFITAGHALFRRLDDSPLPVVAAVQGLCLAGGLELMMACDVVFAGESARFGDQHAQFGLIPGWGGTQRLPRIVGRRRALDLMLSARWIGAAEARDWGLANYVVADDELHPAAMAYCAELAGKSAGGLAAMKRLASRGLDMTLPEGLGLEEREVPDALLAEDVSEGLAAFREKRAPSFK